LIDWVKEPHLNLTRRQKLFAWLAAVFFIFILYKQFNSKDSAASVTYTQFMREAKDGKIVKVDIQGDSNGSQSLKVTPKTGMPYDLTAPYDNSMVSELLKTNVQVVGIPAEKQSILFTLLIYFAPPLLIVAAYLYIMRSQTGGKGGAFSFGKSRAKLTEEGGHRTSFGDVAGCDEAKEEVHEIVDFLKDPSKFQSLGGKIPRGVLLVGPPGTGKTLLAKAIAGEAKVPFFSISGSDFVEMFVGVGAARVRDMFEQAKKQSPCIIFIDEIDAVGRQRGGGYGGGNDEREQTLNQLLVEMDGFEANSGTIVVAATNRSDVLDKALLRPGRFDRQVYVGLPDIRGREQILKVHLKKIPAHENVNPNVLARGTPGFSGADLANLVNEAALFAARRNKKSVDMKDFEDAKDKVYMGPERKSAVMREEEKKATAYHEAGHAIVACFLKHADPVHKVTIMPRGWALGVTWQLPQHDKRSYYYHDMLEQLAILFGGRAAEEIFLDVRSTGASNDFARATETARDIVAKYGMTDTMGPMVYLPASEQARNSFQRVVAESTQEKVDAEIRRLIDEQYDVARKILLEHRAKVETMVDALMEWETIDAEQVQDIVHGRPVRAPQYSTITIDNNNSNGSSDSNTLSNTANDATNHVDKNDPSDHEKKPDTIASSNSTSSDDIKTAEQNNQSADQNKT
jgi:cell division protease FtsH